VPEEASKASTGSFGRLDWSIAKACNARSPSIPFIPRLPSLEDEKSEIGTDVTITGASFEPRLGEIDCKKIEAVGEGAAGTLSSGFPWTSKTVGVAETSGTIPSSPFGEVRSGPIESAILSMSESDSRGSGVMMLTFPQEPLGTVSSRAGADRSGSRMKRRIGSPGPWVPVAATIEHERPDLVRLKLSSKAIVVPFEEESWSGRLGEDIISVKKSEEKSAWKLILKTGLWAQPSPSRFSIKVSRSSFHWV
jgi:hypothetical protein